MRVDPKERGAAENRLRNVEEGGGGEVEETKNRKSPERKADTGYPIKQKRSGTATNNRVPRHKVCAWRPPPSNVSGELSRLSVSKSLRKESAKKYVLSLEGSKKEEGVRKEERTVSGEERKKKEKPRTGEKAKRQKQEEARAKKKKSDPGRNRER